jgi:ribosomal-protein-alanine N-acetyltransferase
MFGRSPKLIIETERLILRPPHHNDFNHWVQLRSDSRDFLSPWDPVWSDEHLMLKNFKNRVYWAQRAVKNGSGCPLFLIRKTDRSLIGAVTLDNIRRGPAQAGTLGYWTGQAYARQGYMKEAVNSVVLHAFRKLDLSRVEAACLPENLPSRGLLENCGFKYEGVAQSYLQIAGRWRTHVLYASIRHDRRGKTEAG